MCLTQPSNLMESRRKKTTPVDKTPKWARTRPNTQEEPAQTANDRTTSPSVHKPLIRKRKSPQLEEIDEDPNPPSRKTPKTSKLPRLRYPQIEDPSLMCLLRQPGSNNIHERWLRVYLDVQDFSQLIFWIRQDTSMDGPLVLRNEAEIEKREYPEIMGYEHELQPSISYIYDQDTWNAAVVHATTINKGSKYLRLFVERPAGKEDGKHVITEVGKKIGPTLRGGGRDREEEGDEEGQERDEAKAQTHIRDLNAIISSKLTRVQIEKVKYSLCELLAKTRRLIAAAEEIPDKTKPAEDTAIQDPTSIDSNHDNNSSLDPPISLVLLKKNLIRKNPDPKRVVTKRVNSKAPTSKIKPHLPAGTRAKGPNALKEAGGVMCEPSFKSLSDLQDNIEKNWNDDFTHITEAFTSSIGRLGATKLEKLTHEFNEKYRIPGIPSRRFFASQVSGIEFIVGRFMNKGKLTGVLLADDIGLGKTYTALGAIFHIKHLLRLGMNKIIPWYNSTLKNMGTQCPLLVGARDIVRKPTLIVTPTELIGCWHHTISHFMEGTSFSVRFIDEFCPTAAEVNLIDEVPARGSIIYLIDYDTYRLRCKTKLAGCEFGIAIFDQSHTVVDEGSLVYEALLGLNAPYRIQLSGTPIYSSVNDWVTQSKWLFPRRINSSEFIKHGPDRLVKIIENGGNSSGKLSYNALKTCVLPWTLRRCAQTTAINGNLLVDIPPMTTTEIRLKFTNTEKEHLKSLIKKNKEDPSKNHPLVVRNWRLASFASDLVDEPPTKGYRETWEQERWSGGGPIFRWMHESLIPKLCNSVNKDVAPNKAVIFAPLPEQVLLVRWWMSTYYSGKLAVYYCHQDIDETATHRAMSTVKFHHDENPAVFILTPESAEGLALSAANYVVLLQKLWNANEQRHALAHVHPITKNQPTKAFILHCESQVDDRAEQLHEVHGILDYKFLYTVMGTDSTIRETLQLGE